MNSSNNNKIAATIKLVLYYDYVSRIHVYEYGYVFKLRKRMYSASTLKLRIGFFAIFFCVRWEYRDYLEFELKKKVTKERQQQRVYNTFDGSYNNEYLV